MPALAAGALWSVGAAWATDAAIYIAANAAVINAVAVLAVSAANNNYQRRKATRAARDAYNASLQDRLVMTTMLGGARSRCYGRVRNVDGIKFKATHGTNSEFYTLVIALCGHAVDAIESVYFGDTLVTLDGDGWVQTAPWNVGKPTSGFATVQVIAGSASLALPHVPIAGSISVTKPDANLESGPEPIINDLSVIPSGSGSTVVIAGAPQNGLWVINYQYTQTASKARVRKYLGGAAQDLYPVLQPLVGSAVQVTDKFANDACLVVTLQFDVDAFVRGVPQISAVIRGAKVHDPRTGLTAWSENPALIARDWALYANGGGATAGEINEPAFLAAANACDISTMFTTPAGNETRPLYQCGTVIPLDSNPDEAFSEMVEAMAGKWGWAGGKLTLRAGVYRAPVVTITESWVTDQDSISVLAQTPTADLINVMRPTISDAAQAYVVAPTAEVPPLGSVVRLAYTATDGRELPQEVSLSAVTRAVHAQHICGVLMRENREGLTISLPCNWRAYQLELFDVVALTLPRFGFSGLQCEVVGWVFSATGGITLTLRKITAAIYNPDGLFDKLTATINTHLPNPMVVESMTISTITSNGATMNDGSVLSRTVIKWNAVIDESVRHGGNVEVQYIRAGDTLSDWSPLPLEHGSATQAVASGLLIGAQYLFKVRAINSLGVRGAWSLQRLHQVTGARKALTFTQATPPPADNLQVDDIWLDSSAAMRQYRWNGTAWVPLSGPVNLIDATWWRPGAAWEWPQQEDSSGENSIVWGRGPKGGQQALWLCVAAGTPSVSIDGGWNHGSLATYPKNAFSVDPLGTYRFAVPVVRTAGTATAFLGASTGGAVCALNTATPEINPYFCYSSSIPLGRWYLMVGYVFPAGSTGLTNEGAGIYDMDTGEMLSAGTNYCWAPGVIECGLRAYQYYATTGAVMYFSHPSVELFNGVEVGKITYVGVGAVDTNNIVPGSIATVTESTAPFMDATTLYNPPYSLVLYTISGLYAPTFFTLTRDSWVTVTCNFNLTCDVISDAQAFAKVSIGITGSSTTAKIGLRNISVPLVAGQSSSVPINLTTRIRLTVGNYCAGYFVDGRSGFHAPPWTNFNVDESLGMSRVVVEHV